jgi:starch synthase
VAVEAPCRLTYGLFAKDPLVLSKRDLHLARDNFFSFKGAPIVSAPALPIPVMRESDRVRTQEAFAALFDLARHHGVVHEKDVEVAIKRFGHDASKAIRETFEAIRWLKERGGLVSIRRAETIKDEILTRLEGGHLTAAELRRVEKIARVELFRLFDDPIRDDDFRVLLAGELKKQFRVTNRQLDEWEVPLDLTLRDRQRRQANALRAVLFELEKKRSPATRELELSSIRRLGGCGDITSTLVLDRIIRDAADPVLVKAAKIANRAIKRAARMTIVFAAMEAKPYCGTGGLSNVMAELPRALAKMGHRVIVLVPRHASMSRDGLKETGKIGTVYGPQGAERFGLLRDRRDGVDFYFVENDRYFSSNREGIYGGRHGDYHDNAERYDFFGAAIPVAIRRILGAKTPDIVQLNDAHTASASVYLKIDPAFENTRTIMAVHNLGGSYQGKFALKHLQNMRFNGLGLFYEGGPAEFCNEINLMKLGLNESDATIIVSREYMKEILTEETGEGLHGVLRVLHARDRLWGNLNGIDNAIWNPETDPLLKQPFSFDDLAGKAACKADLQHRFGLAKDPDTALVGVVARLTNQKGIDDIISTIEAAMIAERRVQFLIVGQGEQAIADQLRALVQKYPGKVAFDQKFTVEKEHLVYAGSDFFMMPSKFEPCGLPQMYALRYLTVPIVRAVGGLNESIQNYDPKRGTGNGFKFGRGQIDQDLRACLDSALKWYETGRKGRENLLRSCAFSDFSWDKSSAVEQVAFFRKIINRFAKEGGA